MSSPKPSQVWVWEVEGSWDALKAEKGSGVSLPTLQRGRCGGLLRSDKEVEPRCAPKSLESLEAKKAPSPSSS